MSIGMMGKAIISKVSKFAGSSPEARLLFAIWERAVLDAYTPLPSALGTSRHRQRVAFRLIIDATRFLDGPGDACLVAAGVDPDYARRVMEEAHRAHRAPVVAP